MNKATAQRARLKALGRQAHLVLAHGRPEVVVTSPGSVVDDLLCTAVCRELRERGQRGIWVITDHPELFQSSPDVDGAVPRTEDSANAARRCGARALNLDPRAQSAGDAHVLASLCRQAEISGPVRLQPVVYLRPDDLSCTSGAERRVALCCAAADAESARAAQVIAAAAVLLRQGFELVQVGDAGDPLAPGAIDRRGDLSPRQAAAVLARSAALLGTPAWWTHLARAVECPSVIVRGQGGADPYTGYPCNLDVPVDDRALADPAAVAAAVRRLAARPRLPLEVASVDLPAGTEKAAA